MAKGKKSAAEKAAEEKIGGETVVLWKATRPMNSAEHEQLSQKLRFESEQCGVKVVLVPFSVDVSTVFQTMQKDDPEGAEKVTEDIQPPQDNDPPADVTASPDPSPNGDVTGDE